MVSADGAPVTPEDPQDPRGGNPSEPKKAAAEKTAAKTEQPAVPAASYMREPTEPAASKLPPVPTAPVREAETKSNGAQPPVEETSVEETRIKRKPQSSSKKQKQRKPPWRQRRISRLVMEFQPDAVEMEHRKVAGGLRWTLYTVILLLIATIAWAWWAQVDRVVMAEGKLIATAPTFVINAPQSSPIRTFKVKFGDTVTAGQELVTLDPTFSEADVNKLETRLNALAAEGSRLQAEQRKIDFDISGYENDPVWINQQILFIDRKRHLEAAREQYEAEIRKLEAEQARNSAEVNSRSDLVTHREEDLRTNNELYQKGAGSLDEVRNARIELKYARNNLLTAEKTVLETESQFVVLKKQHEASMAKDQAAVSLELAQKRQEQREFEEDLNKARRANELVVIYAPMEFEEYKVIEIADQSSVANPGQPIMKLLPVNSPLELEVKVESKDIGLIRDSRDGKPKDVRIKISAYPYMKHGTLNGFVKTINEDITELGQPGMSRSFYYVRVRFDQSENAPTLRDIPDGDVGSLRPGMAATAEIKVGRRRVIDFFIYPLFRSLDTSIREP